MPDPALAVAAANFLMDSVLACSRNVASSAWKHGSTNRAAEIWEAELGNVCTRAPCAARTSAERAETSKASKMMDFPSFL